MNNEYNYIKNSGVVSVKDENDNPRLVEYSDNLEDILATENIVEELENEIEKSKDLKEQLKYQKYCLIVASLLFLVGFVFSMIDGFMLSMIEVAPKYSLLLVSSDGALKVLGVIAVSYATYKHHKNVMRFNQRNSYLNEQLKLAKFKLKTLRKNKSKVNEQEITQNQETQRVTSHLEYLNQLKSYLESLQNGQIPTIQPEIDYSAGLQDKTKKLSIK